MPSYQRNDYDYPPTFVAVGIDFGTTYSGVCWARSTNPEEVNLIKGWPCECHRNRTEIQVPTLYDIPSGKWGYEITPDMKPLKWFKLLLLNDEDIAKEEVHTATQLQEAKMILSNSTNTTAVQIIGSYLKEVWNHTYKTLESILDIKNLPLRVAITVPAIWPAYAQSAMREAATLAGIMDYRDIGVTSLTLVQEPEAAALACLLQRNGSPEIQRNESFVVCDAGGGTVDVISYTVTSEHPFKLDECVPGAGKLSGAFHVDEAFHSYLRFKAKLRVNSLKDNEYNQFIFREWEFGAKRSFSLTHGRQHYSLHPPSRAYGTFDRLRHKDTLKITQDEMEGFFQRSLTGIRNLVGRQCREVEKATGRQPKKILLVGGLGSSAYVYDVLAGIFPEMVLRPDDGWSAVARGAVMRLLHENISSQSIKSEAQQKALNLLPDVTSRRSRFHYGVLAQMNIRDLRLDPEDKVFIDPEGTKITERMEWYLRKGDKIGKKSRIPVSYSKMHRPKDFPLKCSFNIVYSAEEPAPKRPKSGVLSLCRIECDWDKPISEWKSVGDPSKGWRKHDDLELTMGLQGEPKWEIRVGSKKREHMFNIEYAS